MHSCGPYGNFLDRDVQQFIGFPFLTVLSNSITLCGEDQVSKKVQQSDSRSHQDSWSTKSYFVKKQDNTVFHRDFGFVANNTSCSDLPCAQPIDTTFRLWMQLSNPVSPIIKGCAFSCALLLIGNI